MYCLLIKNENSLPTMVSQLSSYFPDYIQSGYEIVRTGTKKEIEVLFEEMILEYSAQLD